MTGECNISLIMCLVCEEGWSLLPVNAAPEQQKCYKMFEEEYIIDIYKTTIGTTGTLSLHTGYFKDFWP